MAARSRRLTDAQTVSPPLILEAKIPVGQVSGRIDHLGIDLKRQRLLVAELGNKADLFAQPVARQETVGERRASSGRQHF